MNHQSNSAQNLVLDLKGSVLNNDAYRSVINTTNFSQLVLMNLRPNQEIGKETHHDSDQFVYIVKGTGVVILWSSDHRIKHTYDVFPGVGITIPSGTPHNVINNQFEELKLFTIYSPPDHPENEYLKYKPAQD